MRKWLYLVVVTILMSGYLPGWADPTLDEETKQAIAKATEAIAKSPTAANYAERARLYGVHKMFKEALVDTTKALTLAPKEPGLYWTRGYELFGLKRYEQALQDCNTALKLSKPGSNDYIQALRLRSNCFRNMGRLKESTADLRKLTALGDKLSEIDLLERTSNQSRKKIK